MNEKEATSVDSASAITLHGLNPADLHAVWPFISRGLDVVRAKSICDWINEDIYNALRTGNAFCLIPFFQNQPLGFAIYYFTTTPFSNKKECLVWVAWSIPLRERSAADEVDDVIKVCFDEIERQARLAGAVRLMSLSSRKGYTKWAKRLGLKPTITSYVKELT